MKKFLPALLSLLIIMTFLSCEISDTNQKLKTKSKIKAVSDPVSYISMGLKHAMGFSIEKKDDGVSVSSIQEFGIAAAKDLFDGAKIISIDGFDPMNLDENSKDEIVTQLQNGKCTLVYLDNTDSEKSVLLEVTRSTSPQKRAWKYVFVSETTENHPPSILILDIAATINKMDFKREAVNFFQIYNSELDEWWDYDEEVHPFDVNLDLENISNILSPGFTFDSSHTDKSGSIKYTGETDVELNYDFLSEFDYRGHTKTGTGNLKSKNKTYQGYVSVGYEEYFFILPFYEELEPGSHNRLSEDQMPSLEKVKDWIILFDSTGGLLELSVDGASRHWDGAYLPADSKSTDSRSLLNHFKSSDILEHSAYVDLKSIEISWLYDVIDGWEGDPYPIDMTITFPDDIDGTIELESFQPYYLAEEKIIFTYVPVSGKLSVESGPDVRLSGFIMRMK